MNTQEVKYNALSETGQNAFDAMASELLDTLSAEHGTVILLMDKIGSGEATLLAAGDKTLLTRLLRAAYEAANRVDAIPSTGYVQ